MDSRSTHNFLDPLINQTVKLKIRKDTSLNVRVTNRDKVLSKEKCEEVIKIHGSRIIVAFFFLSS